MNSTPQSGESTLFAVSPGQVLAVDYQEAGRLCGLHHSTIADAVKAGELRAARVGRAVRIRVADLDAWLVLRTQAVTASSDE